MAREPRRSTRLDQPREVRRSLMPTPSYDPDAFGRFSERIARFIGTGRFLVYMTVFVVVWVAWNAVDWRLQYDEYPFILLTLMLSLQASYAAPLILLAQNRQADRDRLAMEEDRRRAAAQKADTEFLAREIASLRIAVGEVATRDFLRSELNRLVEEIDESQRRSERKERRAKNRDLADPADSGPTFAAPKTPKAPRASRG